MSTWQVLSRCLGPHGHKTIAKNGFLGNSKSLVNRFQCHRPVHAVPPSHTPDHRMQRTGQLRGLLHHVCIVSHLTISPIPRQVLAGPLLSPSCPFAFARIGPEEVRGDFQVCFHLDIVLCRFRNAYECVFDRSNSRLGKMLPSRPPLKTVCWPWWYVISLPVTLLINCCLPAYKAPSSFQAISLVVLLEVDINLVREDRQQVSRGLMLYSKFLWNLAAMSILKITDLRFDR